MNNCETDISFAGARRWCCDRQIHARVALASSCQPLRVGADRDEHRRLETQGERPISEGFSKTFDAHIDVISFSRRVPNHCPTEICPGLANIDDGYIHGARRRSIG